MHYSSDQTSCFKLLDLLYNKLLPFQGLLLGFLLNGSGMWVDSKVVLDYLPRNTGDVRWLPSKHIDIRPQEGNERAFLFVVKDGTDSKGTISANQPCQDLHGRANTFGYLAIGTLQQVINRGVAHSEEVRFPDSFLVSLLSFLFPLSPWRELLLLQPPSRLYPGTSYPRK